MFSHSWSYCNTLVFPLVAMSESPEVCQFSSTETIFQHFYNISVSNPVQRFLKGLGTFAFTENICLYSQCSIQNVQPLKVQVSDCNFGPSSSGNSSYYLQSKMPFWSIHQTYCRFYTRYSKCTTFTGLNWYWLTFTASFRTWNHLRNRYRTLASSPGLSQIRWGLTLVKLS